MSRLARAPSRIPQPTPSERKRRAWKAATGYALRVFPRELNSASRRSKNKATTYTYPQTAALNAAFRPWSLFNRHGWSKFGRRGQATDALRTKFMMSIWERRISHVDRKVKPTAVGRLGLRGQLLKAKVKKRRGLPSRSLPLELVLERLSIKFESQSGSLDVAGRLTRLHRDEMHERLMERKRRQRSAAHRRARPSVADTRIYLWRRRQEWLSSVDGAADSSMVEVAALGP